MASREFSGPSGRKKNHFLSGSFQRSGRVGGKGIDNPASFLSRFFSCSSCSFPFSCLRFCIERGLSSVSRRGFPGFPVFLPHLLPSSLFCGTLARPLSVQSNPDAPETLRETTKNKKRAKCPQPGKKQPHFFGQYERTSPIFPGGNLGTNELLAALEGKYKRFLLDWEDSYLPFFLNGPAAGLQRI